MKALILTMFILLTSCASSEARRWSPWFDVDLDKNERQWDICDAEKYGQDLHMKGFCFSHKKCRTRKTLLGRKKTECKVAIKVCKWGDIPCMIKYNLNNATLIIK